MSAQKTRDFFLNRQPRRLEQTEKLYFLHIPKTGGRSFEDALKKNFKPHETIRINVNKGYPQVVSPGIYKNKRLFLGHLGYEFLDRFPLEKKPYWITMLREPVDRVLSYYYFFRNTHPVSEGHFFYRAQELAFSLGLAEFCRHPETDMLVNNNQFRNLLNTPLIHSADLDGSRIGIKNEEQIELVKRRLRDECLFFGIMERYNQSMRLLAETMGWKSDLKGQVVLNVTPDRPARDAVPEAAAQAILEVNQLDVLIYEFALEIFNRRIKEIDV